MKKGKHLEQLIKCIQEAIKDNLNTTITPNCKIKDKNGALREIDVYIETEIQKEKICIAIECKDYKAKVDIKVVDALIGKCNDLPQVNKKILVSTSGYTKNAMEKAIANGIELYTMSDDTISEIPIFYIPVPKFDLIDVHFNVKNTGQTHSNSVSPKIYDENDNEADQLLSILNNFLTTKVIMSMVSKYMQNGMRPINYEISMKCDNERFVKDENGNKYLIESILFKVNVDFELRKLDVSKNNSFLKGLNCIATTTEFKYNEESNIVVVKPDNLEEKIFFEIGGEYIPSNLRGDI